MPICIIMYDKIDRTTVGMNASLKGHFSQGRPVEMKESF
jgi:hypothetical protein